MQLTQLACLGLSHHTARIEEREYFAGLVLNAQRHPALREMAVLSTCNRVELYAWVDAEIDDAQTLLINFLADLHHRPSSSFAYQTYFHQGESALLHLCRVAAGLESLVIGEAQILGQVSNSFQVGQAAKTIGPALSLIFRTAIQAGKRARGETTISANPASTASVAVALAERTAGDLRQKRVVVVGLGEIGKLTVKILRNKGVDQLAVANRTIATAQALAVEWGGDVYALADLPAALEWADVVFTAASVQPPLLTPTTLGSRHNHPLALVDLAVPRNISPEVATLPGVQLFDVDDLQVALDDALHTRQQEIPKVEAIIEQEVATVTRKLDELAVEPLIAQLRQRAESIRQQEIERSLRALGEVDERTAAQLEYLSRSIINKLLHEPTLRLKKHSSGKTFHAAVMRDLFDL